MNIRHYIDLSTYKASYSIYHHKKIKRLQSSRQGNKEGGFTLIELMIVIAIIGILKAVAIPSFIAYRDKARISAIHHTMKNIKDNLTLYQVNYKKMPHNLAELFPLSSFPPTGFSSIVYTYVPGEINTTICFTLSGDYGDGVGKSMIGWTWINNEWSCKTYLGGLREYCYDSFEYISFVKEYHFDCLGTTDVKDDG